MFQNMDQETPGKTPKLEHQETSSQTLQMDEGCSWLFSVFFRRVNMSTFPACFA